MSSKADSAVDRIIAYHAATKHHLDRYAPGPGGLDWATQPNPFRRYAGAALIALDRTLPGDEPAYESVFVEGRIRPEPVSFEGISRLFFDSLAISAWKQVGDVRWSLRVNPSSGDLHPTEGYLVCGPMTGLSDQPGVYHYAAREHALERRAEMSSDLWRTLSAKLPPNGFLVGFSSILWREAWKYGERAYRYCQHDVGHALAATTLAAAGLGWRANLLDDLSSVTVADFLGLSDFGEAEPEEPDCILAVFPQGGGEEKIEIGEEVARRFRGLPWSGKPNRLSAAHRDWKLAVEAAEICKRPEGPAFYSAPSWRGSPLTVGDAPMSFRRIVHQRRSCLALDGKTGLVAEALYHTLRKTLPGPGEFPFNAVPWSPRLDLALFVHRVEGLDPGVYYFFREPSREAAVRAAFKPEFEWKKPEDCPKALAFYRLATGDARGVAEQIACHQAIAADGAFSLGMIAEFEKPLREGGAWIYPRLFWEAGMIGQVLYLEAEALGIRGTGIGCYFDDVMHRLLGISDHRFQSLYHFTIGGPVDDPRLTTLPAYPPPG